MPRRRVMLLLATSWLAVGRALPVPSQPLAEVQIEAESGATLQSTSIGLATTPHSLPPISFASTHFGAVVSFIKVNKFYVSYSEAERVWVTSPLTASMLRKSVGQLSITVLFKHQFLDSRIATSTSGYLALRSGNSSAEVLTLPFATRDAHALTSSVDLKQALERIQMLTPGPHAVQLRLESSVVEAPLVLTLGEVDASTASPEKPLRLYGIDLWDSRKCKDRCETDTAYEATITTRLKWSELLVVLFSVAYCTAVNWLGPLDFTPWQQRCYKISYVCSALFQLVIGAWISDTVSTCTAIPPAMALGMLYFVSFNLLNVLILTERSHHGDNEDEGEGTQPTSRLARLRRRPAEPRRMFDSIPSSTQLRGMTRVVMVGYRKARYC